MFEQLTLDPGEQGLAKAIKVFYVVAVLNLLGAAGAFVTYGDRPALLVLAFVISLATAGAAALTARGLEQRRRWAKGLSIAMAVLCLVNVPFGTVIGVVTLVYLNRANRAGLLDPVTPSDGTLPPLWGAGDGSSAISAPKLGAIIGGVAGLCLLFAILLAHGRPDSYIEKLLVFVGGGAALGSFASLFFPRVPTRSDSEKKP